MLFYFLGMRQNLIMFQMVLRGYHNLPKTEATQSEVSSVKRNFDILKVLKNGKIAGLL